MLHRVRAHMRFTKGSGLATWARDNMGVRHDQAVHINEGDVNEEPKRNRVDDVGGGREEFVCDLPLMDESHAQDAFNTLSDANVLGQSEAIPDGTGSTQPSSVERHTCYHDESPPQACTVDEFAEGPA